MTDHELCLLAAKAAGYTVEWNKVLECFMFVPAETSWYVPWKPLDSDADAFRLMVDCGLAVSTAAGSASAVLYSEGGGAEWFFVPFGTDKHAATRRAIVRAAAAMGVGAIEIAKRILIDIQVNADEQ